MMMHLLPYHALLQAADSCKPIAILLRVALLKVDFANPHKIVVTLLESTESDLSLSPLPWSTKTGVASLKVWLR